MNKMEQFRLKKLKVTKIEKVSVFILIILICFVYLFYPVNIVERIVSYNNAATDSKKVIKSFAFPGTFQKQMIFEDQYANVIHINNGQTESHFINVKEKKEVAFKDFVKDNMENAFLEKEKDLLLLKYPLLIVDVLVNDLDKTYVFEDDYLHITYNVSDEIETTRKFTLKIYYNEIASYLEFVPPIVESYENESGFIYDANKISVSFTFDDGPNGKKTQTLIDALEDYKMSASFFMVGNKLYYDAETVKKVYNSHSEVAYHSYKHEYFTRQSMTQIQEEFIISNNLLYEITGGHFKLTRPPYGAYNAQTLEAIDNAFIRWNLDTNDWRYRDVEYIKKYVLDNLSDGSIILFHDSYQSTIDAVLDLIKTLYLMDVQVLNVTELAKLKGVNLENHEVYYDFK